MQVFKVVLELPEWVGKVLENAPSVYPTIEARMQLAIELSRRNVQYETGGPFGAAIFNVQTNQLVAPGVNLVVSANCSIAHAEVLAIMLAQQRVGHWMLGSSGMSPYQLVTSAEPCAMCLGAVQWAGVGSLVCGAREEDARRIGLDEGLKPTHWVEGLQGRGIGVIQDIGREEASSILFQYHERGGIIYNGR